MSWRTRIAGVTMLALAACSGPRVAVTKAEGFDMLRDGGYRVAVLPFVVTAPMAGAITEWLGAEVHDDLEALEGLGEAATPAEQAAAVLRRSFVRSLDGGAFQIAELWVTDTGLRHAAIGPTAYGDAARGAELAALLDVDGVVMGEVTDWRNDAPEHPVLTVGLRVRLVDRRSGEVWFEARRSEDMGPAPGPGPRLAHLVRQVARGVADDLAGVVAAAGVEPGTARGGAPGLSFHAVVADRDGPLVAGDRLQVVAIGTAGCQATFDIGRYRTGIPMVEVARTDDPRGARATYVGYYAVQAGEKLAAVPVFVSLTRAEGGRLLRSRHRLGGTSLALGG